MSEGGDRFGKDKGSKPDMNMVEESDWLIVPAKVTNKAKAEELLEGRGQAKENM